MSNCSCYFSPWSSWYRESMLWDRSLVDHLPIVYPSTITYLRWKQRAGSSFIDWETVCGRGSMHLIFTAWLIVPVKNKVCMKFNAFCQWIAWNMSLDRSQFQPNSSIYPGETRRWRAEEFQALRLLERACRSCRVAFGQLCRRSPCHHNFILVMFFQLHYEFLKLIKLFEVSYDQFGGFWRDHGFDAGYASYFAPSKDVKVGVIDNFCISVASLHVLCAHAASSVSQPLFLDLLATGHGKPPSFPWEMVFRQWSAIQTKKRPCQTWRLVLRTTMQCHRPMAIVRTRQGLVTYALPMLSMAVDIYDCHPTIPPLKTDCPDLLSPSFFIIPSSNVNAPTMTWLKVERKKYIGCFNIC